MLFRTAGFQPASWHTPHLHALSRLEAGGPEDMSGSTVVFHRK